MAEQRRKLTVPRTLEVGSGIIILMLHTIVQGLLIFLIILGMIILRLTWGNGFHLIFRYLPKRWQRWLFDEKRPSAEKSH
jgi:hypothetical protein